MTRSMLQNISITKQFIFKRTLGGHLWASFRAFSSTKSRRTALGTPPILSTKKTANPLQIWLTEYALKYELLSIFLFIFSFAVCGGENMKVVYVQALKVDLRAEPRANSAVAGTVARGERANVVAAEGNWMKVRCGKKFGWISRLFVGTHRPIGNADLMKDVKENLVTTTRRRPSSYSVSAAARGLMTSERGREGREMYETDGEALEIMEKYRVSDDTLKKFKYNGQLNVE